MDTRLLLRRLATRVTVTWENQSEKTNYALKQVLLQGIPTDYRLLPSATDKTYPSMLDLLQEWCGGNSLTTPIKSVKVLWQTLENGENKNIHDPCPSGWRIPKSYNEYQPLIDNNSASANYNDVKKNGGVLLHYDNSSDKFTYIRYAGYVTSATSVLNGTQMYILSVACRNADSNIT